MCSDTDMICLGCSSNICKKCIEKVCTQCDSKKEKDTLYNVTTNYTINPVFVAIKDLKKYEKKCKLGPSSEKQRLALKKKLDRQYKKEKRLERRQTMDCYDSMIDPEYELRSF